MSAAPQGSRTNTGDWHALAKKGSVSWTAIGGVALIFSALPCAHLLTACSSTHCIRSMTGRHERSQRRCTCRNAAASAEAHDDQLGEGTRGVVWLCQPPFASATPHGTRTAKRGPTAPCRPSPRTLSRDRRARSSSVPAAFSPTQCGNWSPEIFSPDEKTLHCDYCASIAAVPAIAPLPRVHSGVTVPGCEARRDANDWEE